MFVADGLVIPDDRIVSRVARAQFMANQNFGSRRNGTLRADADAVARYATFTLVAASRPELKQSLVQRFSYQRG